MDSERILTQLRLEGYQVSASYQNADVVVVNTCGFLDSAKQESLDAIGEAMAENGRVIVTGCMGGDEQAIRKVHLTCWPYRVPINTKRWWGLSTSMCHPLRITIPMWIWCRSRVLN